MMGRESVLSWLKNMIGNLVTKFSKLLFMILNPKQYSENSIHV